MVTATPAGVLEAPIQTHASCASSMRDGLPGGLRQEPRDGYYFAACEALPMSRWRSADERWAVILSERFQSGSNNLRL